MLNENVQKKFEKKLLKCLHGSKITPTFAPHLRENATRKEVWVSG